MKLLTQLSRFLVGGLFIFSGLIKLNDPVGFSFKLGDYFAADVLNLPFLNPFTLQLAVFIVILEVILGVALILGLWRKITVWLLLLMIVFFTFLTFYSAYFNKVTDCGCFGDAIPLTPWQSFGKDVILTVLILIVFMHQNYIKPLLSGTGQLVVMGLSLVGCVVLANQVLNHLPLKDFRPYAEGESIIEGMKSAEELGLEPTQYGTVYYLKNENTAEEIQVTSEEYVAKEWWKKKEWQILSDKTESVKIKDGYEPPIHDFNLTLNGNEITWELLDAPVAFLVVSYKLEKANTQSLEQLNAFALKAQTAGYPFIAASASLESVVQEKTTNLALKFPFAVADETALKTIVRSNPGLVLLKNGVIIKKWHFNDVPSFEEVKAAYL
jgi:uncharacterized membrane protein YphA (DoxX/SURF4 family)